MKNFSVPILIEEKAGLERMREPVRLGVPLPRGYLHDSSHLRLKDSSGDLLPLQVRPLAFWPDGTIKWALLDFFATVPEKSQSTSYVVGGGRQDRRLSDVMPGVVLEDQKDIFVVDTGSAVFTIPRDRVAPFISVMIGRTQILSDKGSEIQLRDIKGRTCSARMDTFVPEERGPLRCTLRANGRFVRPSGKLFANFVARVTFFAGLSLVHMEFTIHNPRATLHPGGLWDLGDHGSIFFRDLSLILHGAGTVQGVEWRAEANKSIITTQKTNLLLHQDSSGGANWKSTNHVNYADQPTVSFRGYRVLEPGSHSENPIDDGLRASPYLKIKTTAGWLAGTVQHFWQNFPKALRVQDGKLSIGLFPAESNNPFELQGGEQKRHTMLLDFGLAENDTLIAQHQAPLHVVIKPDWVEKSETIPYFVPQKDDPNHRYIAYINNVIEGPHSFSEKREVADEYGWRNFGDLYADHEAVDQQGPGILVSHYNNQYDFIYGAIVHFLRTGDWRWRELFVQAARHTIDIDIYHTDDDKFAYNHGLFWHTDHYRDAGTSTHRTYSRKTLSALPSGDYGGGPSNEHNYTSGLLYYYYLTGDQEARNAVLGLADWVTAMDEGSRTILGLIDEGPTGLASQTTDAQYHRPGRGAGNSINALLDAYQLTNNRGYLAKAEQLIQRCIHPEDDIDSLSLDEPEYRWSYLVFLQVLGKYLDLKVELGETDFYFFYGRDSVLHYADWMVENEVPYKEVLDKVEIPTETWPAHDIRKNCVFHLAYKYCQPAKREKYSEKALFFFDHCLADLLSFKTAYLTRPLVILAVNGFFHSYFQKNGHCSVINQQHQYDFGQPMFFVPQKKRLKTRVRGKLQEAHRLTKRFITVILFKSFGKIEWKR